MTDDRPPRLSGPTASPHGDFADANSQFRRLTWTMRFVLLGLAASLWIAHVARGRGTALEARDRDVARLALATEVAAANAERTARLGIVHDDSAVGRGRFSDDPTLRASLDSLGRTVRSTEEDPDVRARLAGVVAVVEAWRGSPQPPSPAGLDSLFGEIGHLVRAEHAAYKGRQLPDERIQNLSSALFLIGAVALAIAVFQMRRRLARQLAHALEAHHIIVEQNEELGEKRIELEQQTAQLRSTAAEFETQAAELEVQTTELETTVQELRDAERRQRQLADESALLARRLAEAQRVAQIGYWEIDSETGEVFWSEEMYALAGLDPSIKPPPTDEYLTKVHPDDRRHMQNVAHEAQLALTEFTEVYRLPSTNDAPDSWRTVQSRGRIVLNDRGERKLVGTVQDITERVRLETQLRRAQKMEAVGQLAGGIAHDFNNILTVIDGYSSLLLADQSSESPQREDIEEIRSAAARAATLTRQLLAFSRQQVLQPRVLDLNATIAGVEKMLRRLIGEHIRFETKLQRGIDRIKADPGQLEQVIVNLIVNARDAMPEGGTLTIETANAPADPAHPGHWVMLSITDTGTGIAPENIDRIYEPFFTTKGSTKGTGLGLSTVLGIVEQSGGQIDLATELGKGSTFALYFPRSAVKAAGGSAADPIIAPAKKGSETVLLVEDDTAVRAVAGTALRRAGYRVMVAQHGLDALEQCGDDDLLIDLVVTDMVMPVMGGRDFATRLREQRPTVPILFMSGHTRDAMIHSAELATGESFIEKPFTPSTLTGKVREALDSAAHRRAIA